MSDPLKDLLETIKKSNGLDSLFEYTPENIKKNFLFNLDLEKIKKEFNAQHISMIDFVEILFVQIFPYGNSSVSDHCIILFRSILEKKTN